MLNIIIDSIYSNDSIELAGIEKIFTSLNNNTVSVFCPCIYSSIRENKVFYIPVEGNYSDNIKTIEHFCINYGKSEMIFSDLSDENKNIIYNKNIPNRKNILKKLEAFCSFLNLVNAQISDSSNFHYKLKIFQLFNKHKCSSEDYELFEEKIKEKFSRDKYRLQKDEEYIDEKKNVNEYHALTMYNIFVQAYNQLSSNNKNIIFSSIKNNTEKIEKELFDTIHQFDHS